MQPIGNQTHRMQGVQRTLLYGGTSNVTPKRVKAHDIDIQYVHTKVVEDRIADEIARPQRESGIGILTTSLPRSQDFSRTAQTRSLGQQGYG
jgi:hypothetical protein